MVACETEPATNVTYDAATLNGKGECTNSYSVEWWWEYGTVAFGEWNETPVPHENTTCTGSTPTVALDERVSGLSDDVTYRFRLCTKVNGGAKHCYDKNGTQDGTSYDTFHTDVHPTTTPQQADKFSNSVGVQTHMTYFSTAYGDADDLADKIVELGVKHVRDGVFANQTSGWTGWNDYLYDQFDKYISRGLKFTMGFSMENLHSDPEDGPGTIAQRLNVLANRFPDSATEAIEGPNEIANCSITPVNCNTWQDDIADFQPDLYNQVKNHSDAAIRALPVLGPTFGVPASQGEEISPNLEDYLDYGNEHPYTGCTSPTPAHLAARDADSEHVAGSKPWWATEAGFHTALNYNPNSGSQPACDERTAAVYTLRTVLEHFKHGVPRTFIYELIDYWPDPENDDPKWNLGLLHNDQSPKQAFTALKNLLSTTGYGNASGLTALKIAPEGSPPGDLRTLVLRRADGAYLVCLWRHASVWDRDDQETLPVNPVSFQYHLPMAASVKKVEPMSSATEQSVTLSSDKRVTVSVGGDPVVLVVR